MPVLLHMLYKGLLAKLSEKYIARDSLLSGLDQEWERAWGLSERMLLQ